MIKAFDSKVFSTDRTLELVAEGMSFRDAYNHVKNNLEDLKNIDPEKQLKIKLI